MAETLGQKQRRFVKMTGQLIAYAYAMGYEMTEGRGWESEAANKANCGKEFSNHLVKLAHDWNVFKGGTYLTDGSRFYDLGSFWKSLAPDACWGQDFAKRDGNHFSLEFEGHK